MCIEPSVADLGTGLDDKVIHRKLFAPSLAKLSFSWPRNLSSLSATTKRAHLGASLDDKVIHGKLFAFLGKALVQLAAQLHKLVHSAVNGEVVVRNGLLGLQQPLGCDAPDLTVGNILVVTVDITSALQQESTDYRQHDNVVCLPGIR